MKVVGDDDAAVPFWTSATASPLPRVWFTELLAGYCCCCCCCVDLRRSSSVESAGPASVTGAGVGNSSPRPSLATSACLNMRLCVPNTSGHDTVVSIEDTEAKRRARRVAAVVAAAASGVTGAIVAVFFIAAVTAETVATCVDASWAAAAAAAVVVVVVSGSSSGAVDVVSMLKGMR